MRTIRERRFWRTRREDGRWQEPEFFSRGDVPFISPDGKRLYFVASKQVQGASKEAIFVRERMASGWSEAKNCRRPSTRLRESTGRSPLTGREISILAPQARKDSRIYCSKLEERNLPDPKYSKA